MSFIGIRLLVRYIRFSSQRRVHSCVLTTLPENLRKNGENSVNEDTDFGTGPPNGGLTDEDVRMAPLAFIPVFMGPTEVGHWALLLIADRTEYYQGIFDSLPGFDKKMFHNAKSLLELCGFSDCK